MEKTKTFVPSRVKTRVLHYYATNAAGEKFSKWDTYDEAAKDVDRNLGEYVSVGWVIVKGDK